MLNHHSLTGGLACVSTVSRHLLLYTYTVGRYITLNSLVIYKNNNHNNHSNNSNNNEQYEKDKYIYGTCATSTSTSTYD